MADRDGTARLLSDEQIRSVIREAAATAAPVFKAMGWTWVDAGVPSKKRITKHLEHQIGEAADPNVAYSRSGRFFVRRSIDELGVEELIVALEVGNTWAELV